MTTDTNPPTKSKAPFNMPLSGWVVFVGAIGASIGGLAVEQYKISVHENRIERLERKYEEDSRLLNRMDEKLDFLQRQFETRPR